MSALVAILWFLGGLVRIYHFARFFQIEEYQNRRYFRWLLRMPQRWGWQRPLLAWSVALILGFFLLEQATDILALAIFGLAALAAIWPAREKEIKKRFVRTPRALRLLIASALIFGGATILLQRLAAVWAVPALPLSGYLLAALAGVILFLLAPLALIPGNWLAAPVEAALRRLYLARARRVLRRLEPTVIGITGSYGKTSTKHYLAHILNGRYRAVATPRSYNTLMGVSLAINTVLQQETALDYFIVEMGAYVEGEIAEICRLARPRISIVTAVGPQHLERFGSLEAIARAKYEIVAALPPDGVAILNGDDPRVRQMAEWAQVGRTVLVSQEGAADAALVARNVKETLDGLSFDVVETASGESRHFHAPLYGIHNVTNLLLATAAARQLGLPLGEIALRVAGLEAFEHRLQRRVQPGGLIVLDDAYSANPVGARSALHVLGLHQEGRRILITPGMVELGERQEEENRRLGEAAASVATDILLVGVEQTRPIYEGVLATTFDRSRLHVFETHAGAVAWLREQARPGDAVLFLNDLPDTYL
ncbi:MAG: UDP-N-acetylmuramoyl-tripeptide--D-alanyl-D-alanine ligase [Anaerolineae bacterium]|nr:UDP-N-acetylmuramoyl-tripeptide--D-alanyl-D-alanine ligase [Anaerolineae bacterium]